MIFLTETQLEADDKFWMHGVRTREEKFKIDLLEGKQPNRGWLGPEMSGEEGATFPEKLWWAIDEAKSRLSTEVLDIDENNNIQMVMFACLAKDEADILPGHVWVDRQFLEIENMKIMCPKVLGALLAELNGKLDQYNNIDTNSGGSMEAMAKAR